MPEISVFWALGGIAVVVTATFAIGVWGSSHARTTSDLHRARRLVREERNAAAISGEYLSAASFLGVAGLVLKDGSQALWYPIGFASGYLAVMLFVAAPLRRSGAYTVPDFAVVRLDSPWLRWLTTAFVVLIGWLYLVPQFQAAGLTFAVLTELPAWVGAVALLPVVLASVFSGGMRAVTLVQAFQYWLKLFAITAPAFVLFGVFLLGGSADRLNEPGPVFETRTAVEVETPVTLRVVEPTWVLVDAPRESPGGPLQPNGQANTWVPPGEYAVDAGSTLSFEAGAAVPVVSEAEPDNGSWLHPSGSGSASLVGTYSLLVATFLGTMGLPHVLVRFYTNPSGHGARRTALFVLVLLGTFYLFPTVLGLLSRLFVPKLLVTGQTDAAVLLLPNAMLSSWPGGVLTSLTAAGAFAAFVSTSSGLVVSLSGVVSSNFQRVRGWHMPLLLLASAAVPMVLALLVAEQDLARSIGLAFAMAASTFCPLLVLGVWWRGLTAFGAAAGLVAGGALVLAALVVGALRPGGEGVLAELVQQPALVSVPVAFLVMVLVSAGTKRQLPEGVSRVMLRMHAPDRLGFQDDRRVRKPVPSKDSGGRHRR
ncbi:MULTISPECIES: cation acetate symporter [unclassified Saccharopolyspora]|uniref:sodium/solute symporter n=1 Tax=unclassified Saccharopolyspora TaxID=2646250 RepID=UPI001CD4E39A|nr:MULTISPECIES: cation acetate symporter [unclassified Saccharopolyspora]MCA1187857.1 cation acetate symporter [Saccharopolyspora sp. 6T]MCA1193781.1 cation acetate symporter [Saccharopolyspora sp. 6V]MCA1226987.1 cation acetate symporter [Saccharopolyspora sp. 6M]MCA1281782.1 cation acetate symporter [Saccharopolyspora sp. 7B]